jgi:hypothetical protein
MPLKETGKHKAVKATARQPRGKEAILHDQEEKTKHDGINTSVFPQKRKIGLSSALTTMPHQYKCLAVQYSHARVPCRSRI